MLSRGFSTEPTDAEDAVLGEVSRVLVGHLEHWRNRRRHHEHGATSPVLIQIDGPGRSLFLEKVAAMLDPEGVGARDVEPPELGRWTVIRFDAWQYQRVAPPWWWLIKAIDQQLRARTARLDGARGLRRLRRRDFRWRSKLLVDDLRVAVPPVLVAVLLAIGAWLIAGKHGILEILQWAATAVAAITAVVGVGYSAVNALRRHLLVASPAGAKAVLQTSDPMTELMERYEFLIESSGTDVAILRARVGARGGGEGRAHHGGRARDRRAQAPRRDRARGRPRRPRHRSAEPGAAPPRGAKARRARVRDGLAVVSRHRGRAARAGGDRRARARDPPSSRRRLLRAAHVAAARRPRHRLRCDGDQAPCAVDDPNAPLAVTDRLAEAASGRCRRAPRPFRPGRSGRRDRRRVRIARGDQARGAGGVLRAGCRRRAALHGADRRPRRDDRRRAPAHLRARRGAGLLVPPTTTRGGPCGPPQV